MFFLFTFQNISNISNIDFRIRSSRKTAMLLTGILVLGQNLRSLRGYYVSGSVCSALNGIKDLIVAKEGVIIR